MVEPISYSTTPSRSGPTAREELDPWLDILHESGLLQLANDLATGKQDILDILLKGLNLEGSRYAAHNIAAILMALAQLPPPRFDNIATALKNALWAAAEPAAEKEPPNVRGLFRALENEETRRALASLAQGVMALGESLRKPAPNESVSAVKGKSSDT